MTTQEMYNKGLRCKGRGFNCYGCKDANECVEYVKMDSEPNLKPYISHIGIMPKYIWDTQRRNNLKDAIERYTNANLEVPIEWIEEYNDLVKLYKN